jgi:hypothetical protein
MIETIRMSAPIRRVLFLAITLIPPAMILLAIIQPIQTLLAEQDAEIARQQERLARLRAIASYTSESAGQSTKPGEEYIFGPNEGVASANLQTRLKSMAQSSGTQLRSVQGLPPETDGRLRLIGARLNFAGPIEAVHRAVLAIENARPYVFITNALIKTPRRLQSPAALAREPVVEAQLDVFGAFLPESEQ